MAPQSARGPASAAAGAPGAPGPGGGGPRASVRGPEGPSLPSLSRGRFSAPERGHRHPSCGRRCVWGWGGALMCFQQFLPCFMKLEMFIKAPIVRASLLTHFVGSLASFLESQRVLSVVPPVQPQQPGEGAPPERGPTASWTAGQGHTDEIETISSPSTGCVHFHSYLKSASSKPRL